MSIDNIPIVKIDLSNGSDDVVEIELTNQQAHIDSTAFYRIPFLQLVDVLVFKIYDECELDHFKKDYPILSVLAVEENHDAIWLAVTKTLMDWEGNSYKSFKEILQKTEKWLSENRTVTLTFYIREDATKGT